MPVVTLKNLFMESCLRSFLQLQSLTGNISSWCQHLGLYIKVQYSNVFYSALRFSVFIITVYMT